MSTAPAKKDWSAIQYLKFNNERTRAVYDLVSQITRYITTPHPRIYDLGCGPGNSTRVLLDVFPGAKVTGMDSSPAMLAQARASLPDTEFVKGDVSTFDVEAETPDLLFSNAVFHWLRTPARIPTLTRLFHALKPGAILAIQVPDNYHEPSHRLMREVASQPDTPWHAYFHDAHIGDLNAPDRPDLDPIESPQQFYNALIPLAASVNLWRTEYLHVLADAGAVVEWVKGTGLQPYLHRIGDEGAREAFLGEYERRVGEVYGVLGDGKVLLKYPRLFVVAMRK